MTVNQWTHFMPVNSRYLAYQENNAYFLIDRKPVFLIGYLFYPLNWLAKRKVVEISEATYRTLTKQRPHSNRNSGLAIAAGGLGVLLSRLRTSQGWAFPMGLNQTDKLLLWLFVVVVVALLIYIINRRAKKAIMSTIGDDATNPLLHVHVYPRLNSFFFKFSIATIFLYLLGVLLGAFVWMMNDWLLFIAFQAYIVLWIAYAYNNISGRSETEYRIVNK